MTKGVVVPTTAKQRYWLWSKAPLYELEQISRMQDGFLLPASVGTSFAGMRILLNTIHDSRFTIVSLPFTPLEKFAFWRSFFCYAISNGVNIWPKDFRYRYRAVGVLVEFKNGYEYSRACNYGVIQSMAEQILLCCGVFISKV